MQKTALILSMAFLVLGIALNSPLILAQTTSENPGVTPDSFLWGLDRALEQISLLLAASPNSEAKIGLEIAGERLAEIKLMIEENKLEAAEKAKEEHGKTLGKVKEKIEEIEDDNSLEELEEVIEIEKELEENEQEIEQVSGELKIKIKIEGEITQEQRNLIDSILASLEGQTGEVEIEIKNKKNKIKIEIKLETGKSDEEIDDDIEKLELKAGLRGIKVKAEIVGGQSEVKIERKFSTTTTNRVLIVDEIIEKFALDLETANSTLKIENEEDDEELEERFKVKVEIKVNSSKVEVKLKFILNATDREEILDAIVEKSKLTRAQIEEAIKFEADGDLEDEELEVEVETEDGISDIKVKFGREKFEFSLETTDMEVIISEIVARTGLSEEQVRANIDLETDEDEEIDDENDNSNKVCCKITEFKDNNRTQIEYELADTTSCISDGGDRVEEMVNRSFCKE